MFRRLAGLWVAAAALVTPVGGFVGLNLALMQQLVPLSPLLAAQRLKATFPTVEHVKLFDYNHDYLTALHAAGFVHVVVSIPNLELPAVARDPTAAARILEGLAPHVSAGMRLTIAVGNEPLAPWYNGAFRDHLVPALTNVQAAMAVRRLEPAVSLTVPFSFGIVGDTYPPDMGAFSPDARDIVLQVARVLANNSWPFFINIYPFAAFRAQQVSEDFALLQVPHTVSNVTYPNLLAAQIAATRAALLRLDPAFTAATLPLVIGETGWPTAGDSFGTLTRAQTYITNAVAYAASQPLYLFEAFDELRKSQDNGAGAAGDGTENHWGLLTENGTAKFDLPGLRPAPAPSPPSTPSPHPVPPPSGRSHRTPIFLLLFVPAAIPALCLRPTRPAGYLPL